MDASCSSSDTNKVDPTDAITLPIPMNVPTPILQLVPVLRRLRRLNTLLVFSR